MTLPDGLYDLLVTEGLASRLDLDRSGVFALKGGAAEVLADALTRQLAAILDDVAGDDAEKAHRQLELVNALLVSLRQRLAADARPAASAEIIDLVSTPLRLLKAVQRDRQFSVAPEIGLAAPWLFTAGKGSPSLLQEVRRELSSADQVDILVSFITVSGVRKLQDVLQQITAKGAGQRGRHTAPHTDHDLHRRNGGPCSRRTRTPARLRSARVARWQAYAPAREGLDVPSQDGLRFGLRGQRESVGRGADRRTGMDGQAHSTRPGVAVRASLSAFRDAVG